MTGLQSRTISLPSEQAGYIDAQVASGHYATESEVVRAGLVALQEREAELHRWLEHKVGPAYDAAQADPSRSIPADRVRETLANHHAHHLKSRNGT